MASFTWAEACELPTTAKAEVKSHRGGGASSWGSSQVTVGALDAERLVTDRLATAAEGPGLVALHTVEGDMELIQAEARVALMVEDQLREGPRRLVTALTAVLGLGAELADVRVVVAGGAGLAPGAAERVERR